ncbi:FAD-binding protein [Flavonifractor sp. DFI.6.63]|uniref:FAD-dependent oxidoreductase n=1 Tax=Flavonifractor sp. DFI.6.63 TaxID=2963704 RepID=UPI0021099B17|nr:FAD-binding protein [Flavonifractor sp. DFI.6.63]MCQ5029813.1 FAD-binding protein [Flavonifractor sp. DFI.6.63]
MKRNEVVCDVVVVGGGLAGIMAALAVKKQDKDLSVVVVDKYFAARGGKATRGGGVFDVLADEVDIEEFLSFDIEQIGEYLNEQIAQRKYIAALNDNVELMEQYTGKLWVRNEDGSLYTKHPKMNFVHPWRSASVEMTYMIELKRAAVRNGIQFVDRVGVVDFLLWEGRVAGALGYHIETGEEYVFNGKAVVVCNGDQNYRCMPMWACTRGEGLAAAWRAGAEMTNCEFSTFYQWSNTGFFAPVARSEDWIFNNEGTNIGTMHRTPADADIDAKTVVEWYKQMKASKGPMHYINPSKNIRIAPVSPPGTRPLADQLRGITAFNNATHMSTDELLPIFIGEQSCLKVDIDMKTNIPGLFAAGDACYSGSRVMGAVCCPPGRVRGSGLPFAEYSGNVAGISAAQYCAGVALGEVDQAQVAKYRMRTLAPMTRAGGVHPDELVLDVQRVMASLGYTLYCEENRLKEGQGIIRGIEKRLDVLYATDMHDTFKCNEVRSMVSCAEMFFTAALERRESRGWFQREDYPQRDDVNFLKWIVLKRAEDSEEPTVSFERIPIETYPYQPKMKKEV